MFFEEKKKNLFKLWTRLLTVHNSTCNAVMKKVGKKKLLPFFSNTTKNKVRFLVHSFSAIYMFRLFLVFILCQFAEWKGTSKFLRPRTERASQQTRGEKSQTNEISIVVMIVVVVRIQSLTVSSIYLNVSLYLFF